MGIVVQIFHEHRSIRLGFPPSRRSNKITIILVKQVFTVQFFVLSPHEVMELSLIDVTTGPCVTMPIGGRLWGTGSF
jgi:hypothetical protein